MGPSFVAGVHDVIHRVLREEFFLRIRDAQEPLAVRNGRGVNVAIQDVFSVTNEFRHNVCVVCGAGLPPTASLVYPEKQAGGFTLH